MALLDINWSPAQRQLRQFCIIWFPAFWLLMALWLNYWQFSSRVVVGTAAGGAVVGWLAAAILPFGRVLWVTWMALSFPIGFVVSHVVVGIVYYLVLSPIGLIMKLIGYDPLSRKLDREATSYWEQRDPHPESSRYFRQF